MMRSLESRLARLEAHRERVARLREQYGDPNENLDRVIREMFSEEALRSWALDFCREQGWCDDEEPA